MITKIKNTKELYRSQFEAINQALADSGSEIRINSLEDYFSNVRTIASLTKKGSDVKGKFLIMPLDEPFFEIDANARTINIPANFKRNGIAVQNDHWAEILYFKVDRYYDYQDLASLNIFINWEFTPAGVRTSDVEKLVNVTKAFAPDPDFEPNYLVFGWVVSREMTKARGTLRFSVTFTDSTAPGLAQGYQLSTLVSTVNVNEGLVPELGTVPITFNSDDFFARITNSAIHSEGIDGVLKAVTWKPLPATAEGQKLYKLVTSMGDLSVYSAGEENAHSSIEKFYFPIIDRADGVYEEQAKMYLAAEAVTPDTVDRLDYLWATSYSTTEDLESANFKVISSADDDQNEVYLRYVETKDTVPDVNTVYFKKNGTQFVSVSYSDVQDIFEDEDDTTILYELVCVREITRGGYYTVRAQSTAQKETHALTEDEVVVSGKVYSELVDGVFNDIASPSGNPKAQGWYESAKKTCNSPIKYSNKFIYIPNAEIPSVKITRENTYTPEDGHYSIDVENTKYNYVDPANMAETLPKIHIELGLNDGELDDNHIPYGIGGICYKIGLEDAADQFDATRSIQDIINNSSDHSNAEFENIGTYKRTMSLDIDDYTASDVGDYYIRVFNQKNHTYTTTNKEFVMTLSYPAPAVTEFDVNVVGAESGQSIKSLLAQGETPESEPESHGMRRPAQLNIPGYQVAAFIKVSENLTDATKSFLNSKYHYNSSDELNFEYFLEEVQYDIDTDESNDWAIRSDRDAIPESIDEIGENLIPINLGEPIQVPDSDTGFYRIKTIAHYHDSSRVAYTDLFQVVLS